MPRLGANFCAPKNSYRSQKHPLLPLEDIIKLCCRLMSFNACNGSGCRLSAASWSRYLLFVITLLIWLFKFTTFCCVMYYFSLVCDFLSPKFTALLCLFFPSLSLFYTSFWLLFTFLSFFPTFTFLCFFTPVCDFLSLKFTF